MSSIRRLLSKIKRLWYAYNHIQEIEKELKSLSRDRLRVLESFSKIRTTLADLRRVNAAKNWKRSQYRAGKKQGLLEAEREIVKYLDKYGY